MTTPPVTTPPVTTPPVTTPPVTTPPVTTPPVTTPPVTTPPVTTPPVTTPPVTTPPVTTPPVTTPPVTTPPVTTPPVTTPPPTPADIVGANLAISGNLVAGGLGEITLTVTNNGDLAGSASVDIDTPAGILVTGVDVTPIGFGFRSQAMALRAAVPCTSTDTGCSAPLGEIAGGSSVAVTIFFSVAETGVQEADRTLVVTIGDQALTVQFPVIAALEADLELSGVVEDRAPVAGGAPGLYTVMARNDGGEPTPQTEITIQRAPGLDATIVPVSVAGQPCGAVCTLDEIPPGPNRIEIQLQVSVPVTGASGTFTVLAGDASALGTVGVAAAPARVVLSEISPETVPPAGGTQTYTLTASNDGGADSAVLDLFVTLPTEITEYRD